jgi:hypothetical protein
LSGSCECGDEPAGSGATELVAALIPGMAKKNSKMSCLFFNEIHSLLTNWNISDHLSKVVILYSIHPF